MDGLLDITDKSNSTTGGSTTGGNNNNTDSTSTIAGGRTGGTTGGNTTGGTTEKEEKLPKLVTVDLPSNLTDAEKKEQRRIKDRAKYAEKKKNGTESPAPKKSTNSELLDSSQLNIIILTISSIIASRPGMSQWMITEAEIKQITVPLTNIMRKSEAFSNAGEYADHIALMIACATIVIPRIIITIDNRKKEVKKNGTVPISTSPGTTTGNTSNENKKVNNGNASGHSNTSKNDSSNIFELLPTFAG